MREQIIECSGRIVLGCSCGERVVLLGRIDDWYDGDYHDFSCVCGKTLTFADSLPED